MLHELEPEIETITLVPSDGGKFEISANGVLLYSKLKTGRHAEPGEVLALAQRYLREKA